MWPASQDELGELLERVFELEAISGLTPDLRLERIHFGWLEAREHTQRTVARLSQQLRRCLDDRAYLENKRIMQLLDGISANALAVIRRSPWRRYSGAATPAGSRRASMWWPIRPWISPSPR